MAAARAGIVDPASGRTLAELWAGSAEHGVAMQEVALPALPGALPGQG